MFFVHIDPLADATCLLALLKFYIHTVIVYYNRFQSVTMYYTCTMYMHFLFQYFVVQPTLEGFRWSVEKTYEDFAVLHRTVSASVY